MTGNLRFDGLHPAELMQEEHPAVLQPLFETNQHTQARTGTHICRRSSVNIRAKSSLVHTGEERFFLSIIF
ncbi:MAG: hypothetical protein WA419_19070 [Silvibacterium sp.]